jgi:hypothetical protein
MFPLRVDFISNSRLRNGLPIFPLKMTSELECARMELIHYVCYTKPILKPVVQILVAVDFLQVQVSYKRFKITSLYLKLTVYQNFLCNYQLLRESSLPCSWLKHP